MERVVEILKEKGMEDSETDKIKSAILSYITSKLECERNKIEDSIDETDDWNLQEKYISQSHLIARLEGKFQEDIGS